MNKNISEVKLFERSNILNIKKFKIKAYYDVINPCLVYSFFMMNGEIKRFKINVEIKISTKEHD